MQKEDPWIQELEAAHRALREFSRLEVEALGRKFIYRLQRFPAAGIYGDVSYCHKTIWDEYCHEVQNGPYDVLDWAWSSFIDPIAEDIVESIPAHIALVLSAYAVWKFNDEESLGVISPFNITRLIKIEIHKQADQRNIERFESW